MAFSILKLKFLIIFVIHWFDTGIPAADPTGLSGLNCRLPAWYALARNIYGSTSQSNIATPCLAKTLARSLFIMEEGWQIKAGYVEVSEKKKKGMLMWKGAGQATNSIVLYQCQLVALC